MSFQRKVFKLCGSWLVTCLVWKSVTWNWASVWLPTILHEHGAVLQLFTTKACLHQACSHLLWNAVSQLTEDSIYSDFSAKLWSAKMCNLSNHSLSSLQNSTDSQILPSSCCSVQAESFVFQMETEEWLKTTGKSHNVPCVLPRTL